jgi:hypothetical protein
MPYIINPWRYISENGCPIPLNLLVSNETVFTADLSWGVIKATGGQVSIINDGGTFYAVHTFNLSGTFEVLTDVDVEYLVVAGGGGGGAPSTNSGTGGGGAGGLLTNVGTSTLSLTADTYTITVGDGGLQNTNGDDSSLDTLFTATGGGRGGYGTSTGTRTGGNGGSGGGGAGTFSSTNYLGGTGILGQGFDGGTAQSSTSSADAQVGGGGGGASEVGGDGSGAPSTGIAGDGGDGLEININGTPTYYAGGGGGGKRTSSGGSAGTGGLGGGGNGGANTDIGGNGTPNTGGGGGGVGPSASSAGLGGSGVVIIRYEIDEPGDYEVEWFLSGSTSSEGTDTVNDSTTYTITGLTSNTSYETRVRKVCSVGVYSDWSDKVGFTTLPLTPPINLSAYTNTTSVDLDWDGNGYVGEEYGLEWGLNGYVSPIGTATTSNEYYTVTGLTSGNTYEFKVKTLLGSEESINTTVTATTQFTPHIIINDNFQDPSYVRLFDYNTGSELTFGKWPLTALDNRVSSGAGHRTLDGNYYLIQKAGYVGGVRYNSLYSSIGDRIFDWILPDGIIQNYQILQGAMNDNEEVYSPSNLGQSVAKFVDGSKDWETLIFSSGYDPINTALSMDHSKVVYTYAQTKVSGPFEWGVLSAETGSELLTVTGHSYGTIAIMVDSNDRVITAGDWGYSSQPVYDRSPVQVWNMTTGSLIQNITTGRTSTLVAVDTNDNIIYDDYPGSGYNVDIVKVNSSGVEQWRKTVNQDFANLNQLTVGPDDSVVYIYKQYTPSFDPRKVVIKKWDSSGTLLFTVVTNILQAPSSGDANQFRHPYITPLPISRYF